MSLSYVDAETGLLALVKQPRTDRLFHMDFSAALLGARIQAVDSIVSSSRAKVAGSAPLVIGAASHNGHTVAFRVGGGTSGESYTVTVVVTDTMGNTLEGDGLMVVREA